MNLAIAAVLGVMLAVGLIFLMEYLDSTIKNKKDVARYLGINVIGEIPEFTGEERGSNVGNTIKNTMNTESNLSQNLICYHDPKARASEAYRSLRTNIGFLGVDNQIKIVVVTSPDQAEGKTTTSANIAISMAQIEKRVLIIEGDLRKPKVNKYFDVPNDKGIVDIIIHDLEPESVIKK